MIQRLSYTVVCLLACTSPIFAQHTEDSTNSMPGMAHMHHGMHDTASMPAMTHPMTPGPLGIPMQRIGSGTSWLPDSTPMYAYQQTLGDWTVMLHSTVFLQYDYQSSHRGDRQFGSVNWGMLMATHDFGTRPNATPTSRLMLRTMLSLDPATVSKRGYPLLLQSGESYRGQPLHDRQHPHDLFMELAASYDHQFTQSFAFELYAAAVGEPALGSVAFMHRPSAVNDPFAPLAHHWQDATHISFGVLTAGLLSKTVKLEASLFNGREPDENRYDFDFHRLDSYSGRITINPTPHWSMSGSYGFLRSPEALTPDESIHRMTGGVLYSRSAWTDGQWSVSLIYGGNKHTGDSTPVSHSMLAESNLTINARNTIFGRAEYVQKSVTDLAIPDPAFPPLQSHEGQQFNVGVLALGYIRELVTCSAGSIGLGARGSVNVIPEAIRSYYGTRTPLGLGVFFRYRPSKMQMSASKDMKMPHHM